jgi:hypothetical protein
LAKQKESWYTPLLESRKAFFVRIPIFILIIDLLGMVYVTRGVYGDLTSGFEWSYPGHFMFPIPFELPSLTPVTQPLNPLEAFTYLIFISNSVWVVWISLAIIYVFLPVLHGARNRRIESIAKR